MPNSVSVRAETKADHFGIRQVHLEAFGSPAEADLVDWLRTAGAASVSLVAEVSGTLAGHVLFSPVTIEHSPDNLPALGLAPLGVLPSHQRQGIGSALTQAGLPACQNLACEVVFVLGHPEYYRRFGFRPASEHGLWYTDLGLRPAFMALELKPGTLSGLSGSVNYHPEFAGL